MFNKIRSLFKRDIETYSIDEFRMWSKLVERGWNETAAHNQLTLWLEGVRDIRIADDTFQVYEEVHYEA